jgi:hypothetical protein
LNQRILQPQLFAQGFHLESFQLTSEFRELVRQENWFEVDRMGAQLLTREGLWFQRLQSFHSFSTIETMISIRDGSNEYEEDGIWHDDGSRVFAFSLSLTLEPNKIVGGSLQVRRKDDETKVVSIATPEFGTAILFLTGCHGYEHRTRKVEAGKRVILVGWCT